MKRWKVSNWIPKRSYGSLVGRNSMVPEHGATSGVIVIVSVCSIFVADDDDAFRW